MRAASAKRILFLSVVWVSLTNPLLCDVVSGSGTGFFISSDGYFLTSYHVVKGARKISIRVGEQLYDAKLCREDPANDVALLKADGEFVPMPLDQGRPLTIGDDVFTIGFPAPDIEGFAPKFTRGEISALSGIRDDPRYYQVSIPVQPGNSGGPLVDERGNAIGIIDSTLSPALAISQGFIPQNVNYAVKTAYAMPLVETVPQLRERLVHRTTSSTSGTSSDIREAARKSVGLLVVYSSVGSGPQRTPNKNKAAGPPIPPTAPSPSIATTDQQPEPSTWVAPAQENSPPPSQRLNRITVSVIDGTNNVVDAFSFSANGGRFATKNLPPGSYVLMFMNSGRLTRSQYELVVVDRPGEGLRAQTAAEKLRNGVRIRAKLSQFGSLTGWMNAFTTYPVPTKK